MNFARPRRAHFRLASGVIARDLFAPAKLAGCYVDPQFLKASALNNNIIATSSTITGVPLSIPATANETLLATINVEAKALGNNGFLRLTSIWNTNANANAKTVRLRLNNMAGTDLSGGVNLAPSSNAHVIIYINSPLTPGFSGFEGNTSAIFTPAVSPFVSISVPQAIDPTLAFALLLTVQLANAADQINLRSYICELFRF